MTPDGPATGEPVDESKTVWEVAAEQLTPDKSLARVDARAQQIVGTVSLVGVALTGLGLVAGGASALPSAARGFALAAALAALIAVLIALGSTLLRVTPALAPGNLLEVEDWYGKQFRRAYAVVVAGWLLLLAVGLAAVAAGLALARDEASDPILSIAKSGVGEDAKLTVSVEFTGAEPGKLLRTEVTGARAGAAAQPLARSVTRVGAAGKATASLEVPKAAGYAEATVTATLAGRRCTATLPIAAATAAAARTACASS